MVKRLAILLGLAGLLWVSTARAQSAFEVQHQQAVAANPGDVHLKISLESAQASFHVGETIRIKYEFTADAPGKYVAGARYFDRSQRSVLETYFTDRPADARDGLREFWELPTAITGSRYSAPREPTLKLDVSPQMDSVEITHYLRFLKPGRYRIYVVTHSVVAPARPVL